MEVVVEVPGPGLASGRRWTLGFVPLDKLHQVLPQIGGVGIDVAGIARPQLEGCLVLPDNAGMVPSSRPPAAIYLVTVTQERSLEEAWPRGGGDSDHA